MREFGATYLGTVDETLPVVDAVPALLLNGVTFPVIFAHCGSLALNAKVSARCAGLYAGQGREQSENGKVEVEVHCGGFPLSVDWFDVVESLTIEYSGREELEA